MKIILYLRIHTAPEHYSQYNNSFYFPGDPIVITTVDGEKLERTRQFEVRIVDPRSNPLNVLRPNHVTVTIRDNDGEEIGGGRGEREREREREREDLHTYIIIHRVTVHVQLIQMHTHTHINQSCIKCM